MYSNDKKIISDALLEDMPQGIDITSECLVNQNKKSDFSLLVNEDAVLAGINVFSETFHTIDKDISIKALFDDGDEIKKGQIVAKLYGSTLNILKGERVALNFLCHLSGIAACTRKMINLIKGTPTVLLDTRKTTPLIRKFEKDAILSGGAKNHRFNLGEMFLIKDNHIASCGGVINALMKAKNTSNGKYKIEVEVSNMQQLKDAIGLKPDIIMFDNWRIDELKSAVKLVPPDILTEASGQIMPNNIIDYASTGVKFISSSYMVKNAKWIDFSLECLN